MSGKGKKRPLVALVYRVGKGCKQYSFETVEDLERWCSRHPYKNEVLRVIAVKNRIDIGQWVVHAGDAAKYLQGALNCE